MSYRLFRLLPIISILSATGVYAGPLPPIAFLSMGYRALTANDLPSGAHLERRHTDPSAFLAITADFNGDGEDDEVRILTNEERGDARVVAVIRSSEKIDTYVLYSLPFADRGKIGVQLSPAMPNEGRPIPGIIVFRFDGSAECNILQKGEFERAPLPTSWRLPAS